MAIGLGDAVWTIRGDLGDLKAKLAAGLARVKSVTKKAGAVVLQNSRAIGTGMTATPEQAQDVHRHIRARLAAQDAELAEKVQILYGGSMKGENAPGLLGMPDIDGGLIGGASLKASDFLAIAEAAAQS